MVCQRYITSESVQCFQELASSTADWAFFLLVITLLLLFGVLLLTLYIHALCRC